MAKPYKFSFSYTRWSDWRKCPQYFKFKHVDKLDMGPPSPALEKGRETHVEAAKYVEGKSDQRPACLDRFSVLADQLRALPANLKKVEGQMAFDKDSRPVSWFGPNAHYRFIWDVAVWDPAKTLVSAVDWKTGKPYGSYDDQMQIFSIPAFWSFPDLQKFTGHLLYLDTGDDKDFSISREQFYDVVERTWVNNVRAMEADVSWQPTPSRDACKFCEWHPKKGGPCAVGV